MGATSELFIQMQDQLVNTINQVENGDIQVLDAVIEMRKQREFHEQMLKEISHFESENYNEIELEAKEHQNEFRGAKFEFRNGRKTFSFKGIEEVEKATKDLKSVKDKYQSAWEMKQKGLAPVDEETGEVLQIPTVSYGKSSMVIKLPK